MYLYSVSTQWQNAVSFMEVDIGNFGFAARLGQFLGPFFGFHTYKVLFFSFGAFWGLLNYSYPVFDFQLLSTMMAVFGFFCPNACYGFSGFVKLHPAVTLKL